MSTRILLHGATGVTGRLVCDALARRGVPFAISGRNRERVDALAQKHRVPGFVVRVDDPASIDEALRDRVVVIACAGPFTEIGEPIVAAAARLGVDYFDSTGEQAFARLVFDRYGAIAEDERCVLVPAFAFETAVGDCAATLAAEALGVTPDRIDILYDSRLAEGAGVGTTRGTRLSVLSVITSPGVGRRNGALVPERPAQHVRTFAVDGRRRTGASFPSPEAITVARKTGAVNVTSYLTMAPTPARLMQLGGPLLPPLVRATKGLLSRRIASSAEGPDAATRAGSTFAVVAEASSGTRLARCIARGKDPYGLTAEILVEGAVRRLSQREIFGARGPSEVFDPRELLQAVSVSIELEPAR